MWIEDGHGLANRGHLTMRSDVACNVGAVLTCWLVAATSAAASTPA